VKNKKKIDKKKEREKKADPSIWRIDCNRIRLDVFLVNLKKKIELS